MDKMDGGGLDRMGWDRIAWVGQGRTRRDGIRWNEKGWMF